jgi:WD40 repeat protein
MQFISGEGLDRVWKRLRDGEKERAPARPSSALAGQSDGSAAPTLVPSQPLLFSREGSNPGYYRQVARIGQQVAEALAFAHGTGIIHRDVKPSNLLLDDQGNVWIADFGLASAFEGDDGLTETGDVMGTYRFMAPERFDGVTNDKRGDVYALGVTLYELLTLKQLFPESDRARLIQRILHTQPDAPRKVDPRIPRDLNTIVLKSIEKTPGARYQTAGKMAEDLACFLKGEPLKGKRTGAARRAWMWCKRNPWLTTAAGTFLAAIVTVAILSTLFTVELGNSLSESNRRLAALNFEQGYAALEKGESGPGLLRMAECYRLASAAGDAGWAHTAEANLAAWHRRFPSVKGVFSHSGAITCVAFSPNGRTIATGSHDQTARLWDVESGREIGEPMQHGGPITVLVFSPDGKTVLTGSQDKTARLWHSDNGMPVFDPFSHEAPILDAAFSPDGELIVTGSGKHDQALGSYRRSWMTPPPAPGTRGPFGNSGAAVLWDTKAGKRIRSASFAKFPIRPYYFPVRWVAFSADGASLLIDDGISVGWFETKTGTCVKEMHYYRQDVPTRVLTFSTDCRTILDSPLSSALGFWQNVPVSPGESPRGGGAPTVLHKGIVTALARSPNGGIIATGGIDKTARLWDSGTCQPIGLPLLHQSEVTTVAFGPDGTRLLTGSEDGLTRLWDLSDQTPEKKPLVARGNTKAWALSRDGKRLVLICNNLGLYRFEEGIEKGSIGCPRSQEGFVAVAFSPDGKTIYTVRRENELDPNQWFPRLTTRLIY